MFESFKKFFGKKKENKAQSTRQSSVISHSRRNSQTRQDELSIINPLHPLNPLNPIYDDVTPSEKIVPSRHVSDDVINRESISAKPSDSAYKSRFDSNVDDDVRRNIGRVHSQPPVYVDTYKDTSSHHRSESSHSSSRHDSHHYGGSDSGSSSSYDSGSSSGGDSGGGGGD